MRIASALYAENVNRQGKKVIKEMKNLKNDYFNKLTRDTAIDECIKIVKKYFTE